MHQEERLGAEPEPREGPSHGPAPASSAEGFASLAVGTAAAPPLTPGLLRYLQRTVGNSAVSGLVARSRSPRLQRLPAKGPDPMQASGLSSKVQKEIDDKKRSEQQSKDGEGEEKKPKKASDVDRSALNARKGELHGDLNPVTPKPREKQAEIASTAASAKEEAHAPPKPPGPGGGGAHHGPPGGHGGAGGAAAGGGALATAAQASALAQTAFAQADTIKLPDPPQPVQPPPPVEALDAGGKPVPGGAQGEEQVDRIGAQVVDLRNQGFILRGEAAELRSHAQTLRGNIRAAEAATAQAHSGIAAGKEQLEFRRGVVGQAKQALEGSKQKAATVAAEAPGYVQQAGDAKGDSAPMAGEASGLSGQSSSLSPDDAEAGEKTQAQGQQLGKVSGDIGKVDDAFGKTHQRAQGLVAEAAKAQASNTHTSGKIAETEAALAQTDAKLGQLHAEADAAKARLASFADGPAQLEAQAQEIDAHGVSLIEASHQLEARLHAAERSHEAALRAIPAAPEPSGGAEGGASIARQVDASHYDTRINLNLAGRLEGALPGAVTGTDNPTEQQRAAAQAQEAARRQREIDEINAEAGGHFERLGPGRKALIATKLTLRHLWDGVTSTKFPSFLGTLARGFIDPRVSLMGVVSGFSMALSGVANLLSLEQWRADPIGNLLKSLADIATGITVILGSIVGLATAILVIMWLLAIFTFGALGPAAAAVTPVCTTVISTVFPWTITAAKFALVLNALVLIKNLISAACADNATQLQGRADEMTEDAKNVAGMAAIIVSAKALQAGGRALANTAFGQRAAAMVQGVGRWARILPPVPPAALPATAGAAPAGGTTTTTPPPVEGTTTSTTPPAAGTQTTTAAPVEGGTGAPPSGGGGRTPVGAGDSPTSTGIPAEGTTTSTGPPSGGTQTTTGQPAGGAGESTTAPPSSGTQTSTAPPTAPTESGTAAPPMDTTTSTGPPQGTGTGAAGERVPPPASEGAPATDQAGPASPRPVEGGQPAQEGGQPAQEGGQPAQEGGQGQPGEQGRAGDQARAAEQGQPEQPAQPPPAPAPDEATIRARDQLRRALDQRSAAVKDDPMFNDLDAQTAGKVRRAVSEWPRGIPDNLKDSLCEWARDGSGANPREFANRLEYARARWQSLYERALQRQLASGVPNDRAVPAARVAASNELASDAGRAALQAQLEADLAEVARLGRGGTIPQTTPEAEVPAAVRGLGRIEYESPTAEAYHVEKHFDELPASDQGSTNRVETFNQRAMETIRNGRITNNEMTPTGSRRLVFQHQPVAGGPTLEAIVYVKPDGSVVIASFGAAKF